MLTPKTGKLNHNTETQLQKMAGIAFGRGPCSLLEVTLLYF